MRVLWLTLLLSSLGFVVIGLRHNNVLIVMEDFKTFWRPGLVVPLLSVSIALVIDRFRD